MYASVADTQCEPVVPPAVPWPRLISIARQAWSPRRIHAHATEITFDPIEAARMHVRECVARGERRPPREPVITWKQR